MAGGNSRATRPELKYEKGQPRAVNMRQLEAYGSCTSSARTVIDDDPLGVYENSRRKWPVTVR